MRNKQLWLFNCANTFSGNPKWLFLYIVNHRKDIQAVWISDSKENTQRIRKLGFSAVQFNSAQGRKLQSQAGVFVVNQVKEVIPDAMTGITLLNLWHGVGVKSIERAMTEGDLLKRISKKYVQNNLAYRETQLFLAPSALMEEHFATQIGFSEDQVIRAGYPQNTYPQRYSFTPTYDHDLRARAGVPDDAQIAVYAPTYRLDRRGSSLSDLLPDLAGLARVLEAQNTLLILKMHPSMEQDQGFLHLRELYRDSPWLYFWDGNEDIYEVFSQIDVAIVDYSSILYDLMAAGVKSFIRYIPDFEGASGVQEHALDYLTLSCGTIARTFQELLSTLSQDNTVPDEELTRLQEQFWGYTSPEDLDTIVDAALSYVPKEIELPNLYSFDIFDTLIHRSTVSPESVFHYVQQQIRSSPVLFPTDIQDRYPTIRRSAESAARENRRKRPELMRTGDIEIQFVDIFRTMQAAHELTDDQIDALMAWEIEGELRVVIPDRDNISYLRSLVAQGETVVLISDMYLPEDVIRALLKRADPMLAELPLYLSSTQRGQKSTGWLYVKVYLDLNYNFKQWLHIGDNSFADGVSARRQGIVPELLKTPSFEGFEKEVLNANPSFDIHHLAALLRNHRVADTPASDVEDFVYKHVSLYLVPYVCWVIEDALRRGYRTLYFVSRDGHHLKLIADAIIRTRQLDLKTKYIYGSRTSWRLASQFNGIDPETFSPFGSFGGVRSYAALLKASHLTSEQFVELFPGYGHFAGAEYIDGYNMGEIVMALNTSNAYREHLAKVAKEAYEVTSEYLLNEIDFDEPYGIVEYWGRGYTQDCLVQIVEQALGQTTDVPFYYARSIYPSEGSSIRHNFTTANHNLLVIEAIFANMPHGTVEGFERRNGKIVPVVEKREYDVELFEAMERQLPEFARAYAHLDFVDADAAHRSAFSVAFDHYAKHSNSQMYRDRIAHLRDAVQLGGSEREFAPELSVRNFVGYMRGQRVGEITSSLPMSLARKRTSGAILFRLRKDVGLRRTLKPLVARLKHRVLPTQVAAVPRIESSTRLKDFISASKP